MDIAVCTACGANLSVPGSVDYAERYDAFIEPGDVPRVFADAFTIDGSAACARCGAAVEYDDVPFDNGLGVGGRHLTDFDHRESSDGAVSSWCSCGWLALAADAVTARELAREHESDPPRFEARLLAVRHGVPDLRPMAWLASHRSAEALIDVAQRAALWLWNDSVTGVCIWDSIEGRVVWEDGAWIL
jgi:hypothetical protein